MPFAAKGSWKEVAVGTWEVVPRQMSVLEQQYQPFQLENRPGFSQSVIDVG
jgi:hypothetical protein